MLRKPLKAIVPLISWTPADCGKMLVKELGLMSEPIESLQQRAGALRDFLPTVDIDRLVQV